MHFTSPNLKHRTYRSPYAIKRDSRHHKRLPWHPVTVLAFILTAVIALYAVVAENTDKLSTGEKAKSAIGALCLSIGFMWTVFVLAVAG